MAGIGQGHETASQTSYQEDGLQDADILSSPTLTNFNERALLNGVVAASLNQYDDANRNTTQTGNCAVSVSSGDTVVVAAGTVLLDGLLHSISAINIDITDTVNNAKFPKNSNTLPSLTGLNYERVMLVYIDPTITGKVACVYGDEVNTATGVYAQSPSAHLSSQTIVLASARLSYSSGVTIAKMNDKRVFIRPGPYALTALENSSGTATSPANSGFITGVTASAPITDMGFLFARDPVGLGSYPNGNGETHLFYQSDQRIDLLGSGGAYQITPTHRTSIVTDTYTGAEKTVTLAYAPLGSQDEASTKLVEAVIYRTSTPRFIATLIQGLDFTISGKVVTIAASLGHTITPTNVRITYVHAGHA